ncbi:MAG: ABC transporter permease [Clostridia bacterium]|nr:ABC transporter permease [Clostridia bacterium]
MDKVFKKIFVYGSGIITAVFVLYYLIGRFNYPVVDNHYTIKALCLFGAVLILFAVFCLIQIKKAKKGVVTGFSEVVNVFVKYRFLLAQLIGKEFKVKYRRSYLGIAWSLVNPFLMMIIVSAVFSFVFRFNIENFPAYLILGQIMFNFFSEATQFSLVSVLGSAQLIKKVYVPKYIFPISKTLFSGLNFLITFIPALAVLFYYRIFPTVSFLYLPLFLLYLLMFTLGVGLILAAAEVFLRDVQHLYGVLLLALNYVTPIFYPADSLSVPMQFVLNFNPLYHYLQYFRDVMFYHNCPTVEQNAICLGLSILVLGIGVGFFAKKQKKFILYI